MNDRIEQAFQAIERRHFVLPEYHEQADWDIALPIGYGQTISQPAVVRSMLEWLDVQPGNKVLDIGSGSGWTSALLAHIVGPKGKVYAVERIPELVEFGADNCRRLNIHTIDFLVAGDELGLPEHAPYDRILVSADADNIPAKLKQQLRPGGKLVMPVHGTIIELSKFGNNRWAQTSHPGYVFVPLL